MVCMYPCKMSEQNAKTRLGLRSRWASFWLIVHDESVEQEAEYSLRHRITSRNGEEQPS